MTGYLDCWIQAATELFSQALAGEPQLVESPPAPFESGSFAYAATVGGDHAGQFVVYIDRGALASPLLGEGVDQKSSWGELLREVAESAAGGLLVKTGRKCRVEKFQEVPGLEADALGEPGPEVPGQDPAEAGSAGSHGFLLKGPEHAWTVLIRDGLRAVPQAQKPAPAVAPAPPPVAPSHAPSQDLPSGRAGLDLLLDVELEATLRFGCREMPLGQVLDLGPGDVVQLDRTISDPVDLVVGDKIVARGEVVLVNGNFGLRVTEVAMPRKRLESIRCLF
jgi:flagellar motor switch protein FliN